MKVKLDEKGNIKGICKQNEIPTLDKPVDIKTLVIGKNLFETYKVNGKAYTDNLGENALISIPKKQYIEYEQQKEEIERLNNELEKLRQENAVLKTLVVQGKTYTYGIR